MINDVLITGITSFDCYPRLSFSKYCKQGMVSNTVCIPNEKPDIESVNEIKVEIEMEEFKIIKTILGPKILVYGCINIKIIYIADNCQQSLHSAHWSVPFCDFVLLNDLSIDRCKNIIRDVFIGVEDVCLKYSDNRIIDLSILYIICPEFKNPGAMQTSRPCDCSSNMKPNCNKNQSSKDDYGYKVNTYNN